MTALHVAALVLTALAVAGILDGDNGVNRSGEGMAWGPFLGIPLLFICALYWIVTVTGGLG